ncbi:MAG: DUF1579 family protein [Blastocatellia bacterium]
MKRITITFCIVLFLTVVSQAQETPKMPKPGPEVEKLLYYVGTWNAEYVLKSGPMGPGGKVTAVDRSQMLPGGFFVITHTDGNGAMGELKGLSIMGYDADQKVYTYDAFNNFGEAEHFTGTVQSDTWTWTSERKMGGKPTKLRFIAKQVSPTIYTMKFEMGGDGGWTTVMEGRATKAK